MKCIPVVLFCAAAVVAVFAQQSHSGFFTGQAARLVVGQPNGFTAQDTNSSNTTIGAATGIAVAGNTLFVADSNRIGALPSNNRVLAFSNLASQLPAPTASLAPNSKCPVCVGQATVVLGQPDFVSATQNNTPTQNSVRNPQGVASDGVHLVVADTDDNRVLIWNHIPTSNDANADVVVGQPNFTSNSLPGNTPNAKTMRGPEGVWLQDGKLFVADTQNNRVLIYNQIPTTNGVAADVVVGAPNFTTYVNPDIATQETGATASTMLTPVSVTSDGVRMFVSDLGFNRVLIFSHIPATNGAAADIALGQPDLVSSIANNSYTGTAATSSTDTTDKETPLLCTVATGIDADNHPTFPGFCGATLNFPRYALAVNGGLAVADGGNDRVLIYQQMPAKSGVTADAVLGQIDTTDDVTSDAVDSLTVPTSLAWDGVNLYVSDTYNRRINVYTIGASTVGYDGVVNAAALNVTASGQLTVTGASSGLEAGDVITINVNSATYTYTVLASDTLLSVANALIGLINNANNGAGDLYLTAMLGNQTSAEADILLTARQPGILGNAVGYSATVTPVSGEAAPLVAVTPANTSLTGGGAAANVAPGTVVAINGTNLSAGKVAADTTKPLPTTLGGTQVYFNGIAAPLFMVSPTQITAQVPWELGDQDSINAFVRSEMPDGSIMFTSAVGVTIVPANPGIYYNVQTANPNMGYLFHGSSQASAIVSVDGGVAAGAVATITVNGRNYTYTATALDTLDTVRDGLTVQLNNDPQVSASIAGAFDRIILKARVAGPAGEGIPISGNAIGGSLEITVFDPTTCCDNVSGAPVTPTNPAVPGEIVILYATGLGLPVLTDNVGPLVQTGVPYPLNGPVTVPQNFVNASSGGSTADVLTATLQPGTVGGDEVILHLNNSLVSNPTTTVNIAQGEFISNNVAYPLLSQAGVSSLDPALLIVANHVGDFYQGQKNASYNVTITNNGGGNPTVGTVTVTETIPAGMTLVQMIGYGWTCTGNICTRSDALAATAGYPPITVIVNVASNAASSLTNTVRVTGGGSAASISNDVTIVNTTAPSTPASLSVTKTHSGNFSLGQQNATYTVTVSNNKGAGATAGAVEVDEVLPTGLTLVSMAGANWSCSTYSCIRSDALSAGGSYDVITVTVNVASNAPSSVTNKVVVTGGGSGAVTASDATSIH